MNKSFGKLFLISLLLFFGINTVNSFELSIDDGYFIPHTKININNWSEIIFEDNSNEGFGAFFLGTGITSNTTLTLAGGSSQIKNCKTQLNGYFLTNYTNFLMIPIDIDTENALNNNHPELLGESTKFITGGFFTDCDNGTGIFGYIEFSYLSGEDVNTHKLRAGINKNNSNQRSYISPLQIFSSYNWNTLSGEFYSSLAHFGNTIPSLIGGYTIQNARYDATGNKYVVTGNEIDLIFWSTHDGTYSFSGGTAILNGNISGNKILKTGHITLPSNSNTHKLTYTLSSSGYDDFIIAGDIAPTIVIDKSNINFEPNICTSGDIIASITGRDTTLTISGFQRNSEPRSTIPTKTMTENNTGTYKIWFTNGNIMEGEYALTNIDKQAPIITGVIFSGGYAYFSGLECNTITGVLDKVDNFCGDENITCSFDGGEYTSGLVYSAYSDEVSHKTIVYSMIDGVGNETTGEIYFDWQDVPVTGHGFTGYVDNNLEVSINWKRKSEARAGACEEISARIIECDSNIKTKNITGEEIKMQLYSYASKGTCNIEITDGDSDNGLVIGVIAARDNGYPSLSAEIIDGEGYTKYPDGSKYTNKDRIKIGFSGSSTTEISAIRYSCIEGEYICKNNENISENISYQNGNMFYFNNFLCKNIYTSSDAINLCNTKLGNDLRNIVNTYSNGTYPSECNIQEAAWSSWFYFSNNVSDNYEIHNVENPSSSNFDYTGFIRVDLSSAPGCDYVINGGSKGGPTTIFIQTLNKKSNKSEKVESDTIIYDKISPNIIHNFVGYKTMPGFPINVGGMTIEDPSIWNVKNGIIDDKFLGLFYSVSKLEVNNSIIESEYGTINTLLGSNDWHTIGKCESYNGGIGTFTSNAKLGGFNCECSKCGTGGHVSSTKEHVGCYGTKATQYTYSGPTPPEDEDCSCITTETTRVESNHYDRSRGCYCATGSAEYFTTGSNVNETCEIINEVNIINGTESDRQNYINSGYFCTNFEEQTIENVLEENTGNYINNGYECIYSGIIESCIITDGGNIVSFDDADENPEHCNGGKDGYYDDDNDVNHCKSRCWNPKAGKAGKCNNCGGNENPYKCKSPKCQTETKKVYSCSISSSSCTQYECFNCNENENGNKYICNSCSKYQCKRYTQYYCCDESAPNCTQYTCEYEKCGKLADANRKYFVFGYNEINYQPYLDKLPGTNEKRGTNAYTNKDNNKIELYLKSRGKYFKLTGDITIDRIDNFNSKPRKINISSINIDNINDAGEIRIKLLTGFAKDLAGNETSQIRENTHVELITGDMLGVEDEYIIGTTDQIIEIYTIRTGIDITGTGYITCKETESCKGFSCANSGIISKDGDSYDLNINGVLYHQAWKLQLDQITGNDNKDKYLTGCIIALKEPYKNGFYDQETGHLTNIIVTDNFGPFFAGPAGHETQKPSTKELKDVRNGHTDNGFLFYISEPHKTKFGNTTGSLGSLDYEMEFNNEVVDEYYYITGTAIVNGFFNEIGIKKPTYNYKNPNAWQSTFPVY